METGGMIVRREETTREDIWLAAGKDAGWSGYFTLHLSLTSPHKSSVRHTEKSVRHSMDKY